MFLSKTDPHPGFVLLFRAHELLEVCLQFGVKGLVKKVNPISVLMFWFLQKQPGFFPASAT